MTAAIDWGAIAQLLWVAPLAALVVTVAFALLMMGSIRMDDARRIGNSAAATAYGALALLSGLAFLSVVGFGLRTIINKS